MPPITTEATRILLWIRVCIVVLMLGLIAGSISGIPAGWQLIDMSFGIVGAIPLVIALRLTRRLGRLGADRATAQAA